MPIRKEFCPYCHEQLIAGEEIDPRFSPPVHRECGFRSGVGSLAHLKGRCSCFTIGLNEGDPPGMTEREAARAAMDYWVSLTDAEQEAVINRPHLGESEETEGTDLAHP